MARKRYIALTALSLGGFILAASPAIAKNRVSKVIPRGVLKEKVDINGVVESVSGGDKNWVVVKVTNGPSYKVNLGPKWFRPSQVTIGDQVKIEGVKYSDGNVAAWNLSRNGGESVAIRDKTGRPKWIKNFKHRWYGKWFTKATEGGA